jgi:hypothetical protein
MSLQYRLNEEFLPYDDDGNKMKIDYEKVV